MSQFSLATIVMCIVILSSCATLSPSECQVANWQAIGYTDGTQGRYPDYIMQHAKACSKVGISPNSDAWEKGRQQGLTQYCTRQNAYQLGQRGSSLRAVCPAHLITSLNEAHKQGYGIYQTKQAINNIKQQINQDEKTLNKLLDEYKRLANGENLHYASEKEARAYMLSLPDKIRALRQKIGQHRDNIYRLERKISEQQLF